MSKERVYIGTIRAERATNEWQREYALPVGFKERYTEEEQKALREICDLSDQECEEMRKVYKTFPQKLTLCDSTSSQGGLPHTGMARRGRRPGVRGVLAAGADGRGLHGGPRRVRRSLGKRRI